LKVESILSVSGYDTLYSWSAGYSDWDNPILNPDYYKIYVGENLGMITWDSIGEAKDTKPGSWTPLQYACALGRPELVRMLLTKGVDTTIKDGMGRTALDLCALRKGKDFQACTALLE